MVAKDFGPIYLNTLREYQIIQPLVTPVQSAGNFTMSTISISRTNFTTPSTQAPISTYPGHAAFEVLEGQLSVFIKSETVNLLQGDVLFIPRNTTYRYWSEVVFTKVLHVSAGAKGLDVALTTSGTNWTSPAWPVA
jgi:quercetin dioxygenase-like cupin family protein